MPNHKNTKGMVGISIHLSMETLTKIQKIEGNNLSKKIRTLIEKGLKNGEG
jgi:hypothetical protein